MREFWCVFTKAPIVKEVAQKYGLEDKDARTIVNNAKSKSEVLQDKKLTFAVLDASPEFQEELAKFTAQYGKRENYIVRPTERARKISAEELKALNEARELEGEAPMTAEEVNMTAEQLNDLDIARDKSASSSVALAKLYNAFADPRRMNFMGNWVCSMFTDWVTTFQISDSVRAEHGVQEKSSRSEYFTDPDVRSKIVAAIKNELLASIEYLTDYEGVSAEDQQKADELAAVMDNLGVLLYYYGANMFREEGVKVDIGGNFSVPGAEPTSAERSSEDGEVEEAQEDDRSEGKGASFSVDDRNISVSNKIAPSIKALLRSIRDVEWSADDYSSLRELSEEAGRTAADPYGYGLWSYVDVPLAVNRLLHICQGCETFAEMMEALKRNADSTPWIRRLITALDTTSEYDYNGIEGEVKVSKSRKEQLQTQFRNSFRKQHTRMRVTYAKKNSRGDTYFVDYDVNVNHRADFMYRNAINRFEKKTKLDIFSGKEINFARIHELSEKVNAADELLFEARKIALDIANKAMAKGINSPNFEPAYKALRKVVRELNSVLQSIGIESTKELINTYLDNSEIEVDPSSFYGAAVKYGDSEIVPKLSRASEMVTMTQNLVNTFIRWERHMQDETATDTPELNPLTANQETSNFSAIYAFRNGYRNIIEALTEYNPDSYESNYYVAGKHMYSWANPTTVQTILEKLLNKDRKKAQDYIRERYMADALWYLKPESKRNRPVFYSDMLQDLWEGKKLDLLDYSEKVVFNGKKYEDLNSAEYILSILTDYFKPVYGTATQTAEYRMMIAGDKPRYSSIRWTKYNERSFDEVGNPSEGHYQTVVTRKAIDFFAQELRRAANVVKYAANGKGTTIKNYDIKIKKNSTDPADQKALAVLEKVRKGERVTVDDVFYKGRYVFSNTGASLQHNKFVLDDSIAKTEEEKENYKKLQQFFVDKVFNIDLLNPEADFIGSDDFTVYKDAFSLYMRNRARHYLERMQDYNLLEERSRNGVSSLRYLRGSLFEWHKEDADFMKDTYENEDKVIEFARDWTEGAVELEGTESEGYHYFAELARLEDDIVEFMYNNWLVKANMSQVFDVDLAFYGTTPQYQKRHSQIVSAGNTADPDAKLHDNPVSDGWYRSVTASTPYIKSTTLASLEHCLYRMAETIENPNVKQQFQLVAAKTIEGIRKGFDGTDGQSLVSLTGLRKRLVGQGEWSRSATKELDNTGYVEDEAREKHYIYTDEAIYQRLKRGEARPEDFMHVFAQPQKPFVTSISQLKRADGRNLTYVFQHKNSEFALSYATAFMAKTEPTSQIVAIAKFLEDTAAKDPTKGIDVLHFDSVVKIGENSESIDIDGLSPQETYDKLMSSVMASKKEHPTDRYKNNGVVTRYRTEDYKIQAVKPEHFKKNQQPTGSQMRVLVINNLNDNEELTLHSGKKITAREGKERYLKLMQKKLKRAEAKFRRDIGMDLPREERLHKLSVYLKDAMAADQKFGAEMRQMLSVETRDGINEFVFPLDEPGIQSAVEAMLLSRFRKTFYRQKSNGGIAVQVSSWGLSDGLNMRYKSTRPEDEARGGLIASKAEFAFENKLPVNSEELNEKYEAYINEYQTDFAYFEAEITMPDFIKEMLLDENGKMPAKFQHDGKVPMSKKAFGKQYGIDGQALDEQYARYAETYAAGTWNMDEIRKVVPEEYFDMIAYRLPTQAKYSMMASKIVRFAPENPGSYLKLPLEIVKFTDSDFDIDTDTVEMRAIPGSDNEDIDNEIFDLQYAALTSKSGVSEAIRNGDFSDVSEASYYFTLLESGKFSKAELDAMSFDELKKNCEIHEDLDLMDPYTDIILHEQNSDADKMIGIAAVGVTSHAFISLFNDSGTMPTDSLSEEDLNYFTTVKVNKGHATKSGGRTINEAFRVINDKIPGKESTLEVSGYVPLDLVFDMDGNLIGIELGKYIGGSADAAKDAALARLNINRTTLPIVQTMHRLGISKDVILAFMKQPVIKEVSERLASYSEFDSADIDTAISETVYGLHEKGQPEDKQKASDMYSELIKGTDFELRYSSLVRSIEKPDSQSVGDKMKLLHIFDVLSTLSHDIKNLDSFTRYNSSKTMAGSSVLARYAARQKLERLRRKLDSKTGRIRLPQNIEISDEFELSEFGRLCSMFPYIGNIIQGENEFTEKIITENMPTYGPSFFALVDRLAPKDTDGTIKEDEKVLRALYTAWKNYLLFVGPDRVADFTDKEELLYFTRDFAQMYDGMLDYARNSDNEEVVEMLASNRFIKSIRHKQTKEGYAQFDILSCDITGLGNEEIEKFQADWSALLNFEETRELAVQTAVHFLARAAAFSKDTPVTIMPYDIKKALMGYTDLFANADKTSLSDKEIENIALMFVLNNSSIRKLVPTFKSSPNFAPVTPDIADDGTGTLTFKEGATWKKIQPWLVTNPDNTISIKCPIVNVDGQLYQVTDDIITMLGENKDEDEGASFVVDVKAVQPMGIPEQMLEYTGFPDDRFFAAEGTSGATAEGAEETEVEGAEEPLTGDDELDYHTYLNYLDQEGDLVRKSGTYVMTNFFGTNDSSSYPRSVMSLAKDRIDTSDNTYLESRTYLRRGEKLAKASDFNFESSTRVFTKNGGVGYSINITPRSARMDQHEQAKEYAALIGTLGYKLDAPVVKTYTRDVEKINAVEITLDAGELSEAKRQSLVRALNNSNISYTLDTDSKKVLLVFDADVKTADGVKAVSDTVSRVQNAADTLLDKGLLNSSDITVNFMQQDRLDDTQIDKILYGTRQREKQQQQLEQESTKNPSAEPKSQTRRQVELLDIVDLAIKKREGEKVEDEVRKLFGEQRQQRRSFATSADMTAIGNTVQQSKNIWEDMANVTGTFESGDLAENLIVNVTNWILNNRPTAQLLSMMEEVGYEEKVAKSIISKIKNIIAKEDIC